MSINVAVPKNHIYNPDSFVLLYDQSSIVKKFLPNYLPQKYWWKDILLVSMSLDFCSLSVMARHYKTEALYLCIALYCTCLKQMPLINALAYFLHHQWQRKKVFNIDTWHGNIRSWLIFKTSAEDAVIFIFCLQFCKVHIAIGKGNFEKRYSVVGNCGLIPREGGKILVTSWQP